jgi:hypothetical protein
MGENFEAIDVDGNVMFALFTKTDAEFDIIRPK